VLDLYPDDTLRNKRKEDVFERAINGRAWPDNERLAYAVGDTVRWRWVNGSYLPHPRHLHGFHFDVTAHSERGADTTYLPADRRTVVTEFMVPGSTFAMAWVPTSAGHWLMHCHMRPHVTPWPPRPGSARRHDAHDVERHAITAMEGLVLGVTVADRGSGETMAAAHAPEPARRLRLVAQARGVAVGMREVPRGFVLQRAGEPAPDSVEVPGSPLVLVRGQTTAITVVNRLREHTTVHWHGMELESVYDGVSGWSRAAGSVAPLVAPGDSFTVAFTPPRAGTSASPIITTRSATGSRRVCPSISTLSTASRARAGVHSKSYVSPTPKRPRRAGRSARAWAGRSAPSLARARQRSGAYAAPTRSTPQCSTSTTGGPARRPSRRSTH